SLPTDVILPDAITVALNTRYPGSTIVKGDYDKPDKVIVPANTNSVTFVVNTWDNNVLDHDRILILEGGNTIYNVTPGTVLIHDSTSLKPQNLIITIGRDTIYSRGTATVRVKLPDGISTSSPITVNVFEAAGSTIAGMDYNMDANAEIPAGTGSGILHVTVPATADHDRELKISGAASGFIVKDGGVYIRKSRINVVPLVSDNGDGINDFLKIEGIERYTSKFGGSNNVILFSRWEEVIYEAGNYDNTTIKFNGRGNKRGAERVPDGVYFYAITIEIPDNELGVGEPKKQTFKGYFRLQK
ncbi:MAG: gliding motility-associated C-terminal domain-containing protein, partial [Filimonas sp.]|nr:gliding motility-associated C-terminal domain-containing protein [Filimonas sp.]